VVRLPTRARRLFSEASRPAVGSTKLTESVPEFWVKLPWHEIDCLPLSNGEVNNEWSYTFIHTIRLRSVHRDVFTFILSPVL
jgi:hypothetical protein